MTMTHWKKTLNKEYLGAHDLDDGEGGYSEIVATIDHVALKKIKDPQGNDSVEKVATFKESIKPMILNVDACKHIERFTGTPYIEKWGGCRVQIYVKRGVKAFGDIVDAIRIRDQQPREREELTPEHPKWDGAVKSYAEHQDAALITKYFDLSEDNYRLLCEQAGE